MSLLNVSKIYKELDEIKSLITLSKAEFIEIEDASKVLKLKKSYLYKLCYQKKIPYYKPNGKKIYFNLLELNAWIAKSKVKSVDEINDEFSDKK